MSDPQEAVPQGNPPILARLTSAGLVRIGNGEVMIGVMVQDESDHCSVSFLKHSQAEVIASRLSALSRAAAWVNGGGETQEPITDL